MSSGTPDSTEPVPDVTKGGSLAPGSTATGAGESNLEQVEEPHVTTDGHDPDALVEGNRVATAEDMEG